MDWQSRPNRNFVADGCPEIRLANRGHAPRMLTEIVGPNLFRGTSR